MEEYLMETPSIVYMNLLSIYCSGSNNQSEDWIDYIKRCSLDEIFIHRLKTGVVSELPVIY